MNAAAVGVVELLRAKGSTIATAESLTGGLVCATLVSVAGASDVVRGGVVAYDPEVKVGVLGVDAALVADRGTIDPDVARSMAEGVRRVTGSDLGVATTGNAGPEPSEGKSVGLVYVAVADARGSEVRELELSGDRLAVRERTVDEALSLVVARLREEAAPDMR